MIGVFQPWLPYIGEAEIPLLSLSGCIRSPNLAPKAWRALVETLVFILQCTLFNWVSIAMIEHSDQE